VKSDLGKHSDEKFDRLYRVLDIIAEGLKNNNPQDEAIE